MEKRASGVLCHITSLPSPFGIGDFGPGAYAFADFLLETKQSYWQVLPFNPTNAAHKSSPFNSKSAFAGNTLFISPELLEKDGLLEKADLQFDQPGTDESVDYPKVTRFKRQLFDKAYRAFRQRTTARGDYEYFCKENAGWLDDFAMFAALDQRYQEKPVSEWPEAIKSREHRELSKIQKEEKDRIDQEKFLQFVFYKQWFTLKAYCNDRGIQIIGDFPFFMDCDSADLWTNPSVFKVDAQLKPYAMAGSPPDNFSPEGQLFNCSVYDWEQLKKSGYRWWVRRFEHMLRMFDILRIDHFRGLIAYWEVPAGDPNAVKGKWQPAEYYDLMNTLLRHIPTLPLFAEDLGSITPDIREAMQAYEIPGIKMILFAFEKEDRSEAFLPHNHVQNCVVYTGTHDTDTCRGWFDRKDNAEDKELFFQYIGRVIKDDVHWEYIRMAMSSVARTAIIPLQDILGLGAEARMNKPGDPEYVGWLWRFKHEQLTEPIKLKLAEMTATYGRA